MTPEELRAAQSFLWQARTLTVSVADLFHARNIDDEFVKRLLEIGLSLSEEMQYLAKLKVGSEPTQN